MFLKSSFMLSVLCLVFSPVGSFADNEMPTNPDIISGKLAISSSSNSMTVDQISESGIINWDGFSIGSGNSVDFNNGTGTTLNRVTGSTLSTIYGNLSATGSLYLINQNGIIFGNKGIVDVGGDFVGSTLGVSNTDFLNGGDTTFQASSSSSVVNLGSISSSGGDVSLIAHTVLNSGSVTANNGSASLVAGSHLLMHDASLDSGKFVVQSGSSGSSVIEKGVIEAATVELKANGGNIYALAGNTEGMMRATGVMTEGGKIFLTAGDTGSVTIEKSLKAVKSDGSGGAVDVTAGTIVVSGNIDVSSTSGTGGSVYIFSEDRSEFTGTIDAFGNGSEGASGFIEVSSHKVVSISGAVNTGVGGTFLIDPEAITISENDYTGSDVSYVKTSTITGALNGGSDVIIWTRKDVAGPTDGLNKLQQGDISVEQDVLAWGGDDTSGSLVLLAMGDILVTKNIYNTGTAASGANLTLIAGWDGETSGLRMVPSNGEGLQTDTSWSGSIASITSSGSKWGNATYGGDVLINGAHVGSRFGATNIYANNVVVGNTGNYFNDTYVGTTSSSIGFNDASGGSSFNITGDINLTAKNNITVKSNSEGAWAGIGHIGDVANRPSTLGDISGNISITAGGAILLDAKDSTTTSNATIGHNTWTQIDPNSSRGDITIQGVSLTLLGGDNNYHRALIGGHENSATVNQAINITLSGDLVMTAGNYAYSAAQIGHVDSSLQGILTQPITISAANITMTGGSAIYSQAVIGSGWLAGLDSAHKISGSHISVTASGTLTMVQGTGGSAIGQTTSGTQPAQSNLNVSAGVWNVHSLSGMIDNGLDYGNVTIVNTGGALTLEGDIVAASIYDLVVRAKGDLTVGSASNDWSFTNTGSGRIALASIEGNFLQDSGSFVSESIILKDGSYWQIYSGLHSLNTPITAVPGIQNTSFQSNQPFNASATALNANTYLYRLSDIPATAVIPNSAGDIVITVGGETGGNNKVVDSGGNESGGDDNGSDGSDTDDSDVAKADSSTTVSVQKTRSITDFLKNGADTCKGLDEQAYAIDCLSSNLEELANSLPTSGDYADAKLAFEKGAEKLKQLALDNASSSLSAEEFNDIARPLVAVDLSVSNAEVLNAEINKIYDEIVMSPVSSDENSDDRSKAYKQISSVIMLNKVLLRSD